MSVGLEGEAGVDKRGCLGAMGQAVGSWGRVGAGQEPGAS